MSSRYYEARTGAPAPVGRTEDLVEDGFDAVAADMARQSEIEDFSGSGPVATTGTVTLSNEATAVLGALAKDASGSAGLVWIGAGDLTLAADGLEITNTTAGNYSDAADTFVVFYKPALSRRA